MHACAGVVTVKRPIDYETDESLVLVVAAGDDGEPPLSATATVSVQVLNVNDESPMFQNISQVSMMRTSTNSLSSGASSSDLSVLILQALKSLS